MKMYLQVRIENQWTVPLDRHISYPSKNIFFSLHSAEGFLKKFCATNSVLPNQKEKREEKHTMSVIWL